MAAKRPYWGTNNNKNNNKKCDKDDNSDALHSPNTIHFRPSQRLTLWNSGKMRRGKWDGEVLFCCWRSDEEITHNAILNMICDVHFGDTRNDITPATIKWLPNDHTEEQYTTNNNNKKNCDKDNKSDALHNPNTIHFRPSQRLTLWNSGKMRRGKWDGEVLFCCVHSDEEITHKSEFLMICDVHFGDTRND